MQPHDERCAEHLRFQKIDAAFHEGNLAALKGALSCSGPQPRSRGRRTDVAEILSLLLKFGADPNQRGINDYTPLHMAVAERHAEAVRLLLDAEADSTLRTRIDDCETPLEMAERAGLCDLADLLRLPSSPKQ